MFDIGCMVVGWVGVDLIVVDFVGWLWLDWFMDVVLLLVVLVL